MPTRHRYVLSLNGKEEVTKGERRRNGYDRGDSDGESGSVKAQVVKTAKVDV